MKVLERRAKWTLFGVIAGFSLFADLVTKWLAHLYLPERGMVTVIDGYWDFVLAANEGAAFSLLDGVAGGRVLLSAIGMIAVGAVIMMARTANRRRAVWSLALILGGALGNLIERILFGRVTDFVFWHYQEHPWPIFNIADVVLVVGVGLLLIDIIREGKATREVTT